MAKEWLDPISGVSNDQKPNKFKQKKILFTFEAVQPIQAYLHKLSKEVKTICLNIKKN